MRHSLILRGLIGVSFSFLFSCTSIKNTPKVSQPPPEGMVLVPAGIYTMGGRSSQAYVDEFPKHEVSISAFYQTAPTWH